MIAKAWNTLTDSEKIAALEKDNAWLRERVEEAARRVYQPDLLVAIAARICEQIPRANPEALVDAAKRNAHVKWAIRGAMLEHLSTLQCKVLRVEDNDGEL